MVIANNTCVLDSEEGQGLNGCMCIGFRVFAYKVWSGMCFERPQAPLSHSLPELNFIKGLLTPNVFELHCQKVRPSL
jgi:hypothetical protein